MGQELDLVFRKLINDRTIISYTDFILGGINPGQYPAPAHLSQIALVNFRTDGIRRKLLHHNVDIGSPFNGAIGLKAHAAFAKITHGGWKELIGIVIGIYDGGIMTKTFGGSFFTPDVHEIPL